MADVSILVLMEVLQEKGIWGHINPEGCVSILVLMEVLQETDIRKGTVSRKGSVSILVLMEVLQENQMKFSALNSVYVSILVLMEVLQESEVSAVGFIFMLCFNPCSDGSIARDEPLPPPPFGTDLFQSLF